MRVAAVIVTYNRKVLLAECLQAVSNQTLRPDSIILIDNASTDGTDELIKCGEISSCIDLDYHRMDRNLGGAGGFYEGIKLAAEGCFDWIWIMDDDTIPEDNCLEMLMDKVKKRPGASFFASCVKGPNGEPMNVPAVSSKQFKNGYCDWYLHLAESIVKIESATFVSILINGGAIEKIGLPCREFFIWGDDTEYTMRLTSLYGEAYLVGNSWVCHKRYNAVAIDVRFEQDKARLKNYHYMIRNSLVVEKLYLGEKALIRGVFGTLIKSIQVLRSGDMRILRFRMIMKGLFEYVFQYHAIKDIINGEVRG